MSHSSSHRCLIAASLLAALLLITPPGHAQTEPPTPPADTPVGHWVAEHPSKGGIGSWWDFRSDGTLTMHIGAIVTGSITRSGSTITMPAATTTGPPIQVTFTVDGETLHLKTAESSEQTFTRVGPAPSATDPLLGKWKPVPPATPSTDPTLAANQKLMANALYVFSADNTESIRIPFTSFEGTWDATAHTLRIQNQPSSFTFQRAGSKLVLGQPPDGQKTDTYIPDPIL